MSKIIWQHDIHSVGIEALDKEHQTLFGLINALEQHKSDSDYKFFEDILKTLQFYTENHFAHEERIMTRMHYSRLTLHKKQHQNFIKNLRSIEKEFEKNKNPQALVAKTLDFLENWLIKHVIVEDRAYGEFLIE